MRQMFIIFVCFLGLLANYGTAFKSSSVNRRFGLRMASTTAPVLNPFEQIMKSFQDLISPTMSKVKGKDLTIYDDEINEAKSLLVTAAETKKEDPEAVLEALMSLEKLMRSKNKLDDGKTSLETLANLDGAWRLIFTTGTIDTQKKLGAKINYFPIQAAQCFDTDTMTLTNGIYLGPVEVVKFFGDFEWKEKARKVEFDFDAIAVFGIKFNLPKGGAAKIGASSGLGSEGNVDLVEKGVKPFFNWISADSEIATARGGGGGLALWKRDLELQAKNAGQNKAVEKDVEARIDGKEVKDKKAEVKAVVSAKAPEGRPVAAAKKPVVVKAKAPEPKAPEPVKITPIKVKKVKVVEEALYEDTPRYDNNTNP